MNKITELQTNEIFVFGSNALGNHAGGAARQAVESFGAIMGQAKGLQGQSYGIVTLDEAMQRVPLAYIGEQLRELNEFAASNPEKRFLLTLVGCGIAGFSIAEIKGECVNIQWSANVVVPLEFQQKTYIKGFDKDLCCRGFQFEIGKEYWLPARGELALCSPSVFHFCESLQQVHEHYPCTDLSNRYCEVEALGEIVHDGQKCGARGIRILREIAGGELDKLKGLEWGNTGLFNSGYFNSGYFNSGNFNSGNFNSGNFNSGYRNSGDRNSGYRNSGDRNSGDFNSGNFNSGDFNSGDFNSGYFNSGDRNSGDRNSGDRNSGDRNSGDRNSGDRNSGDNNSGNFNSGYFNSGNFNSGDFNSGYRNSGVFCTRQREDTIIIFDEPSSMSWDDWYCHPAREAANRLKLTEWVPVAAMTEKEKADNPHFLSQEGCFRVYSYKEAWARLWACLSDSEKNSFFTLPNFSAAKFEFITGIKIEQE